MDDVIKIKVRQIRESRTGEDARMISEVRHISHVHERAGVVMRLVNVRRCD